MKGDGRKSPVDSVGCQLEQVGAKSVSLRICKYGISHRHGKQGP